MKLKTRLKKGEPRTFAPYEVINDAYDNDLNPFIGRLFFDIKNLKYGNSLESDNDGKNINTTQYFKGELKHDHKNSFQVFGEKTKVQDISIIIKVADNKEKCRCNAIQDILEFTIFLKRETFDELKNLVNTKNLNHVSFSFMGMKGFYSEWTPELYPPTHTTIFLMPRDHAIDNLDDIDDELISFIESNRLPSSPLSFSFNYSTNQIIINDNKDD